MEQGTGETEHNAIIVLWLQALYKIAMFFKKEKAMRVHRLFRVFIIRKQ